MGSRVRLALVVLACSLAVGCGAQELKGTPFYTGEYQLSQGPARDRVNLWPLLYYRRPALSVMWPVFEYVAGEYVAVRPLLSVYDINSPRPVVNVLWPFCQFAPGKHSNRIFPAFWGRDGSRPYLVVFPFAWYSKDEHVGFFPLFLRYAKGANRSTHVLWPIGNVKSGWGEEGWRVWPFYGQYRRGGRSRRYALWPLAMSLRSDKERKRWLAPFYFSRRAGESEKQDMVLPLFYRSTDGETRTLVTLPYGFRQSGQTRTTLVPALLSAYSRSPEGKSLWAVFPLVHWWWDDEGVRGSHLFPFYYWRRRDGMFLSLPYSFCRQEGRGFTNVLGPVFHEAWHGSARSMDILWPLIKAESDGDRRASRALGLYSYRRRRDRKRFHVGPSLGELAVAGREWSDRSDSWWVFPFFAGSRTMQHTWGDVDTREQGDVHERHFVAFPLVWHYATHLVEGTRKAVPEAENGTHAGRVPMPALDSQTYILPLWGRWRHGLDAAAGQATGEKGFWLLGWLYDSKKSVTERQDDTGELDTYVRRRVLWRLMHYERRNDQTSLDVFPGITYDKKPGESKTFSVLWRLFRYDWDKEKGTKVHVFFIPFG